MASTSTSRRLLASVGVHSDEARMTIWIATFFAVTQASHGVGANAADTLFFVRFGVEDLPLMFVFAGPAVMITIAGHSTGLAWRGASRWLVVVMAIASMWVGCLWAGTFIGATVVYPVVWVSTQALIFLTLTVMWNAAGASCTTRQAKRLFPVFASAGVAGGVVGNLMVGPLATMLGADNLLMVQGLLLIAATVIVRRVSSHFRTEDEESESVVAGVGRAISAIASSRLLKLAAVVVFLLFALFYLVVFPFSEIVTDTFPEEANLAGFLGIFSSLATAATFLFSLFVTGRLFSRLGLVMTFLSVPIVYLVGFSGWLIAFGIVTATLFRGVQWIAVNSVQTTAYSALFNVLRSGRRGPVMSLMTAVPAQLGTMAAGFILLLGQGRISETGMFAVGAVVSALALVVVATMRPAYLSAVMDAVRRGLTSVWDVPQLGLLTSPVDRDVVEVLESYLADPRPRARAIAAAGLGHLGGESALASVEELLDDADPLVRSAAFESVCQIEPSALEPRLLTAIEDESADVRLNAIHYIGSTAQAEIPIAMFSRILEDPDPRVRAAGAWLAPDEVGAAVTTEMAGSRELGAVRAVLAEMARHPGETKGIDPVELVAHDDAGVRAAAMTAIASSGTDLQHVAAGLDDRSVRVRRSAARALATSQQGQALLLDTLQQGSVLATGAALEALTPMDSLEPSFTEWAANEARRAAFLSRHRRILESAVESSYGSYLVRVLKGRVDRLVGWVLTAMTTSKTSEVMPLVARGVKSDDPETHAQAVEALESVGERSVLAVLLPLLEQAPDQGADLASRTSLEELAADFDPWLSDLASRCLEQDGPGGKMPNLASMSGDTLDELDEMGRILALQNVPMFSELDPEDLILIARITTETQFDPGEVVYQEGEPGTELLVIVEGSVVVSRSRDGIRQPIETYRPGEHVGELSLLTDRRRSADVHAGETGLRGLFVTKAELTAILEERPMVAMGMLGTLAERLIDQT